MAVAGFEKLDGLCREAIRTRITPGLAILAADAGVRRVEAAWGDAQLIPCVVPASMQTIYDVASLTKAVSTSVLAMQMVARGALTLDVPVSAILPEFGGPGRDAVSVRQLLSHSAGLPAHRPFYENVADSFRGIDAAPSRAIFERNRRYIEEACAREPFAYAPGARSLYTDLGFVVLGSILERLAGARLATQFDAQIARPLGLRVSGFVDLSDGIEPRARILETGTVAATEDCPVRGRIAVGEVHDLNAYAMGGIAGHAGLFSTAEELGKIAEALVMDWQGGYAKTRLVSRDVVREFWQSAGIPGSTWRLGWDGPAPDGSQAGEKLSRHAVGHLGFTGCSLWIDPERARWIVVMSNRIHPAVPRDSRFRGLRPALHDAIVEAFSATPDKPDKTR